MAIKVFKQNNLILASDNLSLPGLSFVLSSRILTEAQFLEKLNFLVNLLEKHPACLKIIKALVSTDQLGTVIFVEPKTIYGKSDYTPHQSTIRISAELEGDFLLFSFIFELCNATRQERKVSTKFSDFDSAEAFADQLLDYEYQTSLMASQLIEDGISYYRWPQTLKDTHTKSTQQEFLRFCNAPSPLHHGFSAREQYIYRHHDATYRRLTNEYYWAYGQWILTCGCDKTSAKKVRSLKEKTSELTSKMKDLRYNAEKYMAPYKQYQALVSIFSVLVKKHTKLISNGEDSDLSQKISQATKLRDEIPRLMVSGEIALGLENINAFNALLGEIRIKAPVSLEDMLSDAGTSPTLMFSGGPVVKPDQQCFQAIDLRCKSKLS